MRDSYTLDRDALAAYLAELLDIRRIKDYGPNGLQIEGRREIRKLLVGVSSCVELFERAIAARADAVLVHHGLFWEGLPRQLTGFQFRRVATLIRADVSLFAYHLPLDAHFEFGNNAVAARDLGLVDLQPFAIYDGTAIGWHGRFPQAISSDELMNRCRTYYGQEPHANLEGKDAISTLGLVSGGGQKDIYGAIAAGLDAFLTGETTEWVMNVARESGIHYLACGHYATERIGVRALGAHLAEKFGIEVEFVDVPNSV